MELRSANEYDELGARAVLSVLLEIGQVLGDYRERFVVIGGSVPWLLFPNAEPAHVGTLDVDLSLDAQALGDGDYKRLVDSLLAAGYELANFAVQKAHGAGVAMRSFVQHRIDGTMPDGRRNSVELRVASIPALLVMKGYALAGRDKHKDAYDIYFSVREFEGGADALAQACRPLLDDEAAFGPVTVRRFLNDSAALGDMSAGQVQVDAFRQVRAWLDRLGL